MGLSSGLVAQNIIHVAPGASGSGSTSDPAGFISALNTAANDGGDTEIRLRDGTYTSTPYVYDAVGGDGGDLAITGGWNSDFTMQSDMGGPFTVLDGGGTTRVLELLANDSLLDIDIYLDRLIIQNGFGSNKSGAGVYANSGDASNSGTLDLFMERCDLIGNQVDQAGNGGAVYVNGYFEIDRCLFDGNESLDGSGGAIISKVTPDGDASIAPLISRTIFRNNRNGGNQGSSIWTGVNLYIEDCEFTGMDNGTSSGNGSAVWGNGGSHLVIERSYFHDILIQFWGSAIQSFDGDIDVSNCLFVDNKAGLNNGYGTIAYYHNNSPVDRTLRVTNCTFVGNASQTGTQLAGAIHFRPNGADACVVRNCIFNDNEPNPLFAQGGGGSVGWSAIDANYIGFANAGGMVTAAPGFVGGGDYHLLPGAPTVDSGTNGADLVGMEDLDGTPRVLNNTVDMGCFEFNVAPELLVPIGDQTTYANSLWSFQVPPGTFSVPEPGDDHVLSPALTNGQPWPAWLTFDDMTNTFSGVPSLVEVLEIEVVAQDLGGLFVADTFLLEVLDDVSIAENELPGFQVHPVPCMDRLTVEIPAGVHVRRVELVDLLGQVLQQEIPMTDRVVFDVSGLGEGAYLVRLVGEERAWVRRAVRMGG